MKVALDSNTHLSTFDALVADGVINYGPSHVVYLTDQTLTLQFRTTPALLTKPLRPAAPGSAEVLPSSLSHHSTFGPGSDLANAHPRLTLGTVKDTHLLVLNLFAIFRPQYLLLTVDSYARQTERLSDEDLSAAWELFRNCDEERRRGDEGRGHGRRRETIDDEEDEDEGQVEPKPEFYIIYNSGKEAGCSRVHKHLQILPLPPPSEYSLFPDRMDVNLDSLPHKIFIRFLKPDAHPRALIAAHDEVVSEAFRAYKAYMHDSRPGESADGSERHEKGMTAAKGREGDATYRDKEPVVKPQLEEFPHNVIMTKRWIAAVPRRRVEFRGASANAAGMMGMNWMPHEEDVQKWRDAGLLRVLGELGIPNRWG